MPEMGSPRHETRREGDRRWRRRRTLLVLPAMALAALLPAPAAAQLQPRSQQKTVLSGPHNLPVVRLNWATRQLNRVPPFEEAFLLEVPMPAADSVRYEWGRRRMVDTPDGGQRAEIDSIEARGMVTPSPLLKTLQFAIRVHPLKPDVPYLFRFTIYPQREKPVTSTLRPRVVEVVVSATTSFGNHLMTDAGVAMADRTGWVGLVSNVHVYAVPINLADDLKRSTTAEQVLKRVSLFAGLAFQEFRSDEDIREFFDDVGSPVAGVGLRRIPYIPSVRVDAGVMWYKQRDANPLVDEERIKRDVFLALGIGLGLEQLFRRHRR